MKKYSLLLTALFSLIWIIPSHAMTEAICLEEAEFIREKGKPVTYTEEFEALYDGLGTLTIKTNALTTSARITLNGQQVFDPGDFKERLTTYVADVTLVNGINILEVYDESKPGSVLWAQVSHPVDADAAAYVGPEGGTVVVEDPLSELFGASIEVPENSFNENLTLIIESVSNKIDVPLFPAYEDCISPLVEFKSSSSFDSPVQICMPVNNISAEGYHLYYLDELIFNWVNVDTPIHLNIEKKTICGNVNHFTKYAVTSNSKCLASGTRWFKEGTKPSCLDKIRMMIFLKDYRLKLLSGVDTLYEKDLTDIERQRALNEAFTKVFTEFLSLQNITKKPIHELWDIGAPKAVSFFAMHFGNDAAEEIVNYGFQVLYSYSVTGQLPAIFIAKEIALAVNDFMAAKSINELNERMYEILIADEFLYRYYSFAGDYGLFKSSLELGQSASLEEMIEAIANETGWKSKRFWGLFEDYEVDNVISHILDGLAVVNQAIREHTTDTDEDGNYDFYDNCPDTPEGEEPDENGCSISQRAPKVANFGVQPQNITDGDSITASYNVTDNQALAKVELWRALYNANNCKDTDKSGCAWTQLYSQNVIGDIDSGTMTDAPSAGAWWYGLHVVDKDNNCTTEENKDCTSGLSNGGPDLGLSVPITVSPIVTCTDSDGDTYDTCEPGKPGDDGKPQDCNDSDASIYPGAPELCDGKNNDCNESTVDGSAEAWIDDPCDGPDTDQCKEGTFVCSAGIQVCSDITGDNVELCDGSDNDCDGQIDEGVTTTFYQDADYDGYGNIAILINDCLPPAGYVADNTDCDDTPITGATIHPGAEEICGDGIDQDCDGNDTSCGPDLPSPPTGLDANYDPDNGWNWITWNAVAEATEYHVYWGTEPGVTISSEMLTPTSTTEYSHTGVVPGSTYYYRVAAVTSAGESDLSDEVSAYVTPEDFPVYFPDPNLRAAIREAISKPTGEIMYSDLQDLTDLIAQYKGIIELEGLQYCLNLIRLRLDANQISNISPLAGLTNLSDLGLFQNQITDISVLAGLTNLSTLSLDSNQITDFSVLAGLTNLSTLSLSHNQITDISILAGLTNLSDLGLAYNQITDISVLAGLTSLSSLELHSNQITDISVLAGLTNLSVLSLASTQITDISVLAGLTNLEFLHLGWNQLSDISVLAGLTSLRSLLLNGIQITDISVLAGLTNLIWLNLTSTQITDISILAAMVNLSQLHLGSNQITDISVLAGLTNLRWLDLSYNQITDINPLVNNLGIGSGDNVFLNFNPLTTTSCDTYIPELISRGATVYHDCPTINPTVSVSPTSGPRGTIFNEPGSGFTPNSTATLYFNGPDGPSTVTDKPTLSDGSYSHSWTCDNCPVGTYSYYAVDDATGTQSNTVNFSVY